MGEAPHDVRAVVGLGEVARVLATGYPALGAGDQLGTGPRVTLQGGCASVRGFAALVCYPER